MWEREVNRGGKELEFWRKTANNKKTPTKPLKTQHKPNTHIEEPKPRTYIREPQSHARQDACLSAGKVTKAKAAARGVFPAFGITVLSGDIRSGPNVGP